MNSAEEREADNMTMKRVEETTSNNSSLFDSATEDELLVSQILLGLENLIPLPIFNWGFRKRRSCLDASPSAPPSTVQISEEDIEVRRPPVKAEEAVAADAAISSPATPLSFPPSESDGKSKRSSKKRISFHPSGFGSLLDMIEELTKDGDLLRVKVENVRKQYNKLKAQNSELRALKQEALKTRQRKEEPQREIGRLLNLGMDIIQPDQTIILPHQQPFVVDQTAHELQHPFGPNRTQEYPPNNGLQYVNGGPLGIPDLNLTPEEAFGVDSSQPLDVNLEIADKRVRFAEARRMRKGVIKIKSMRSACGIKSPRT